MQVDQLFGMASQAIKFKEEAELSTFWHDEIG